MTDTYQAIETRYGGCNFRSRLEARWAVFFDAMKIRWDYEPEGFVGYCGQQYLPDFVLPEVRAPFPDAELGVYVEVKGSDRQLREDGRKIGACIDYDASPLSRHGLLILGPVPLIQSDVQSVFHPLLRWNKGVQSHPVQWYCHDLGGSLQHALYFDGCVDQLLGDRTTEDVPGAVSVDALESLTMEFRRASKTFSIRRYCLNDAIIGSYNAARSARFEHGQSGAT